MHAQTPWFNAAAATQSHMQFDDTVTESMFSCNDDVESTNILVPYSVMGTTDHKPKRVIKAERK